MATKSANLELQKSHFNNFSQYLSNLDLCSKTLENLLDLSLVEVSTAFELAISKVADIELVSKDQYDFSDKSDAKLSTVRTHSEGKTYSAPISKWQNKIGALRVQVFERKQNKFYYFVIPRSVRYIYSERSTLEIPFHLDGTPARESNRRRIVNLWDYEVGSFHAMARLQPGEPNNDYMPTMMYQHELALSHTN
tara:strand:- start:690 stop:1271 length:582 start_codon:yes stop_codon:yes gene_type:complete